MSKSSDLNTCDVDVAIIGGGIAGLWLLNHLCGRGFNAILLEHRALGSDQSIASQGMIHGGIKYTLSGAFTRASEAIAGMPERWRACLSGKGDVDLTRARELSDHFYMMSSASFSSNVTTFLASKATRGRVRHVDKTDFPPALPPHEFHGTLYRLQDVVLDVPSVIGALADNAARRIFQIDWSRAELQRQPNGTTDLLIHHPEGIRLRARRLVLTAGKGNAALLQQLGASSPAMQLRPLHQVMVKHRHPHCFYGHCLGREKTPRLTISCHPCKDGDQVWYLGGSLAENGVGMEAPLLIERAKSELAELMPWVDLRGARWATLRVDRAEPRQKNLVRPDNAFAEYAAGCNDVIVAWPTKLALSPNLASAVTRLIETAGITPSRAAAPQLPLPVPEIAATPWQQAFGSC